MKNDLRYNKHHDAVRKYAIEIWHNSEKRANDYVYSLDHNIRKFLLEKLDIDIGVIFEKNIDELWELYYKMENNEEIRDIEIFKRGSIYRRAIKCYIGALETFMSEPIVLNKEQKKAIKRDCRIHEGNLKTSTTNTYERNANNRIRCIEHYGFKCYVCGFDFQKEYGKVGENFIEVHHVVPLSKIKENHEVDPIRDMRPMCSNCHSMIHRTKNCPDIEDFKGNYIKHHKSKL